jgi:hypothetical protein
LVFGRRSHARFNLDPGSFGMLRVLRDVIVRHVGDDELVAVGREAATVGDILTVQIAEPEASPNVNVRVVESRPIVVDGAVRHQLRLQRIGRGA